VHNVHAGYYGATEPTGHPQDEWGFAISGGIQLKNLPTGPGDKLSLDATYADGATKYLISGVTGNNFDHFSGGNNGFYNSFAALALADGVFTNGGSIEKTNGWGFRGAYVHNWTPNWNPACSAATPRSTTTQGCSHCAVQRSSCSVRSGQAATRLRDLAGRYPYCMDPGQEPDLLGRSHVHQPRPG
jgi:hypothetical protein